MNAPLRKPNALWRLGDSLINFVSGLGTDRDKAAQSNWILYIQDQAALEASYRSDWMARKAVDIPPQDSTREWRAWQASAKQIEILEEVERKLKVRETVRQAMIKSRLYGGGAIILGVDDGDQMAPLWPEKIKQGQLKFIHHVSRYEVNTGALIDDLTSPWFGEPEYYERQAVGIDYKNVRLHPSRVVRFVPHEPTSRQMSSDGWGDSVLQSVDDAIKAAASSLQGIAALVQEAKVDIIGVPDLAEHMSTEETSARFATRWNLAAQTKSMIGALLIDKDETWQQMQVSFSGLPDLMRVYLLVVSGAVDIPATRMLGQSPTGLNSTGDSDIRNYYDRISSDQNTTLRPALERLDEVLITSALGSRDPDIHYDWNPLWQMDEAQRADIAEKRARVFQIDVQSGVLPEPLLRKARENQLIEDGTYPGIEDAIEEFANVEVEAPEPMPALLAAANANDPAALPGKTPVERVVDRMLKDAQPRTLYMRRDVVNIDDLHQWARAQKVSQLNDDLHVTIARSRCPIDWMKIESEEWGQDEKGHIKIQPGGVRIIEKLGHPGQMVAALLFTSSILSWRHERIARCGASWDWPDYQPHVTLFPVDDDMDLSTITPYRGEIVLGPEVFEEIDPNR